MFKTNWAVLNKNNIKAPLPSISRGISNRVVNMLNVRRIEKYNILLYLFIIKICKDNTKVKISIIKSNVSKFSIKGYRYKLQRYPKVMIVSKNVMEQIISFSLI